jgi:hypothetical protein
MALWSLQFLYVSAGLISKKFYVLSTEVVYVFTDLRTNSDYFPIQHSWLFLYQRWLCLLRGRDLPLNMIQVNYSLYRIHATTHIQSAWKLSCCVTIKLTKCIQSNTTKALFEPFKDETVCLVWRPSSYLTVNTLCHGYTNQSVNAVLRNNRSLFWDPQKAHKCAVGRTQFLNVKAGGTYSTS